ncbi:hypothetical protein EV06_1493 [Prochlorococcus sp. MIT 0602]|nr:hypothetical protein EV06_1493 [Prochlorococcus sp. MIT 0602]KGG17184.1 hypothetical protein EV07_0619 [Prochlorococcus sp. MIT 0603]
MRQRCFWRGGQSSFSLLAFLVIVGDIFYSGLLESTNYFQN